MLKNSEILEQFNERAREFLDAMRDWRRIEVNENYSVIEGKQWTAADEHRFTRDKLPTITINKISPIADAIAGFEIQNRSEVKITPRLTSDQAAGFSDLAENGVEFLENQSRSVFEDSQAFKDMLICGVGATDLLVDYENDVNGEACKSRIFPGFLMWDPSARKKNLIDANWCGVAQVVDVRTLEDDDDEQTDSQMIASYSENEFLDYYSSVLQGVTLTVIYDYQWRIKEPVIRIENPFGPYANDPIVAQFAQIVAQQYKLNLNEGTFTFKKPDFRNFAIACEQLGIQLGKPVPQKRFCYYRCQIRNGQVYDVEKNYSQRSFSLRFMTGKWSEKDQCFYGMVRHAKPVQRLYNEVVSEVNAFLRTSPKGGVFIERTAVDDMPGFVRTYTKGVNVTVVNDGALTQGRVLPKQGGALPAGLPEMMQLLPIMLYEVCGVTPDFMGITDSREMTGKLQGQLVRQAFATLAHFFDAKKFYTIDQGYLFIDCLRQLAENNPGRLIRITGQGSEQYVPLLLDNIAEEYDIEVSDVPMTPTERQETFERLSEFGTQLLQQGVNIMPLVLQYAPLKKGEADQIMQAMQPPPPPPPDPLQQGLLQSEIILKQAMAEKTKADAMKIQMDAALKEKELMVQETGDQARIYEAQTNAQIEEQRIAAEHIEKEQELRMKYDQEMQKLDLERQKAEAELQLKRETQYAELALKAMEIQKNSEMQAIDQIQPETEMMPDPMAQLTEIARSIEAAVTRDIAPKHISVIRDKKGNIQGAEVVVEGGVNA